MRLTKVSQIFLQSAAFSESIIMSRGVHLLLNYREESLFCETNQQISIFFAGLVDCYVASHRTREAIQCAAQAYKQLGTNARSLTVRRTLSSVMIRILFVWQPKAHFVSTVIVSRSYGYSNVGYFSNAEQCHCSCMLVCW